MDHCTRMKYLVHSALILLVACGNPAERAAEQALREGESHYRAGQFEKADSVYAQASFDPRVAYNLGNTYFRQEQLDTAIKTFTRSIEGAATGPEQARAQYNLGNSWMALAYNADSLEKNGADKLSQIRIEGDDIALKVRQFVVRDSIQTELVALAHLVDSALAQGSEAYKNSLRRTPKDEDARHNLGLAQGMIAARVKEAAERATKDKKDDKDKGLSERAKAIMAKADELVEQYKFTEALKVMQDGLKTDPTLQQRQDYMHKLDVVTKAAQAK